jgi:basic membrane protein A
MTDNCAPEPLRRVPASGRRSLVIGLLLILALFAAACGSDSDGDDSATDGVDYKACQVSDTGGIDDKSFNETAYKGVTDSIASLGIEGSFLESQSVTDFRPNIDSFINQGCDLIITVGFLLGDDTAAAAADNPDQQFAIVDVSYDPPIDNVLALTFATDEAAFLAGYLAAGMSETGTVGTFGGVNIPSVTIFMDGYLNGVNHYNDQKGTSVRVLGWDGSEGLFTGNFESTDDGRAFGENLISEGADIIMPVAGPVGLGTAAAAQGADGVKIIGVDSDWFESASAYQDVTLTSVRKNMDAAVATAISDDIAGIDLGTLYIGTLANNGVGLAAYHNFDDDVPQELKDEIDQLRQDIISGTVSIN